MLLHYLLKFDGYPPAVLLALALHGGLAWFFLEREIEPQQVVKVQPMQISAATAKENPQKLRRIEQQQQQRAADQRARDEARAREQAAREREAQQRAEAERKRQAEQQRQREEQQRIEQARKAEEERQAQARRQAEEEANRRRLAEQQRQQQLEQQRQRAEAEAARQAQANAAAASAENDIVSQYIGIIQELIQQNWAIPPSARNGMVAVVEIRTTPVGDITSYQVIQSSGDSSFDRSVLQAVARVGNLQELRDLPNAVYERNFRRFNLEFRPEDLLR
jgi:colicin import membrane protein